MEVQLIHHIGKREHQEDSCHIDDQHRFFIVSDGVGGMANGKLASTIVTHAAKEWLEKQYHNISTRTQWINLSEYIFQQLKHQGTEHTEAGNSGSTTVIAIHKEDLWHILHVGDSRCYYIHTSEQHYWRTKDHSLVQELYDSGIISSEEMHAHPKRNVVTRAFQSGETIEVPEFSYHFITDLQADDIILLCSDGVGESFPGDSIVKEFLKDRRDWSDTIQFISEKCELESKDNSTIVVIKL